jgi:hypothetical protein
MNPHQDISYIARTNFRNQAKAFGIRQADRRHHFYCIGKTGSGKTTLLRNLILQDIEAGRGVAVFDPHGDLAHDLLDHIPRWRTDHVVYFNPADLEHPIGFNLLEGVPSDVRHLVASSVVSAFKNIWSDSWGPRLEYILYNSVAALLEHEGATILGIARMLQSDEYRARVVSRVKDPIVRAFWLDEFERYDRRLRQEAITPVQNKVGQFLTSAPVRNILGQVRSKIDPRFMMDNQRILIANLSKGQLGEDKANLLGSLLITKFQLAAMARANIPEEKRVDFHLYIDEFYNFTTSSFATILSEARKYRLCLMLSHQYIDQLSEELQKAVFGNVGTLVSFQIGSRDARLLAQEFDPTFAAEHLISLDRYHIYLKLVIDGVCSKPFSAVTLEPYSKPLGRREVIVRRSREKYSTKRAVIEGKINRWMTQRDVQ